LIEGIGFRLRVKAAGSEVGRLEVDESRTRINFDSASFPGAASYVLTTTRDEKAFTRQGIVVSKDWSWLYFRVSGVSGRKAVKRKPPSQADKFHPKK
jgi:hypothetical protein